MLTVKPRSGGKPVTDPHPPHLQITELSPRNIYHDLNAWVFGTFKFVREEPTRASVPSSRAMWLREDVPASHEVFMPPLGSREFAHTHIDGSMHLMLHSDDKLAVIEAGWGEPHPQQHQGVQETLVYAPRDVDELKTVKSIFNACYRYVTGKAGGE
jgi:hypothetical protein